MSQILPAQIPYLLTRYHLRPHVASLNPYSPCIIVIVYPKNNVSNERCCRQQPFLISDSKEDLPVYGRGGTWSAINSAPLTPLDVENWAMPVGMGLSIVYAVAIGVVVAVIPDFLNSWLQMTLMI